MDTSSDEDELEEVFASAAGAVTDLTSSLSIFMIASEVLT